MPETPAPAAAPWSLPWPQKKAVLLRAWKEASDDNIGIVAAGVAFYAFLAIVPLLGALVLSYGIFADPRSVVEVVGKLTEVMPDDAARLVGDQLATVVEGSDGKKGLGLALALGIALFGARNGAGAIITALNIAYEEHEDRNIVVLNLTAIAITAAAVLVVLVAAAAMTMLGALDALIEGRPVLVWAGRILSYLVFAGVGMAASAALYRFGPSRKQPRWQWITPGSAFTAAGWMLLTLGFGLYVARFGNYNATYGALGAIVVLLTWLFLSSYILLFGAELNSEFEHQVAGDTTTGHAKALGNRGAWVADHVAGEAATDAPAEPRNAEPYTSGKTLGLVAATAAAVLLRRRWVGLALLGTTALASRAQAATPEDGKKKERS